VGPAALLTGSPGAVLEAVARALSAAGFAPRHVPVTPQEGLRLEMAPSQAAVVVHLGVRTPRGEDEGARAAAEAGAAAAAAELARAAGARRLVHVSTVAVYGRPRNLPCREGELKAPRTAHERIRWRAEQASWAAFRRGAPLTVLRPTILYGPSLRGGPLRALALVALLAGGRRRVPILRRGPVAHLVHLDDLASAVVHVASHPDDRAVVGRAFNVGDDAPLPLAEILGPALSALGYEPGRILPDLPRLYSTLLWLFRHVPDAAFLERANRALAARWHALAARARASAAAPRIDREALHWMSADHYYETTRLGGTGWRPLHPISTGPLRDTLRALLAHGFLGGAGAGVLPSG
jgi:nucleoside-diphosphate-sugar epimerase